jgi:hypothetical protein
MRNYSLWWRKGDKCHKIRNAAYGHEQNGEEKCNLNMWNSEDFSKYEENTKKNSTDEF